MIDRLDVFAIGFIDQPQESIGHASRQSSQQIHPVVVRHLFDQSCHMRLPRTFGHFHLFFDGKVWDAEFRTLDYGNPTATQEARNQLTRYYSSLLTDAIWLAEHDPADLANSSRARLLRASVALDLLAESLPSEEEL